MARALSPDMVFWAEGGHDWDAWNAAFSDFIKSDPAKKLFLPEKN